MGDETQSPRGADLFEIIGRAPEVAARHGLSALIAHTNSAIPPSLRTDAQHQIAAGVKTRRLTLAVVDSLAKAGVSPILLKGYCLAKRLYEQPLARPASDVDVLVAPFDLATTTSVLTSMGFEQQHDTSLSDPFSEHHHLSFADSSGLVEVHFRLFSGFGGGVFDDQAVQSRALPYTLEGRAVRILAPEDELLYLAVHAANHAFLRLSWLVDLATFLEKSPSLDWSVMSQRAHNAGFYTAFATALEVTTSLLHIELPASATRHVALSRARQRAVSHVFSTSQLTSAAISNHWLGSFLVRYWLVDSHAHGLRHLGDGLRRQLRRHLNSYASR